MIGLQTYCFSASLCRQVLWNWLKASRIHIPGEHSTVRCDGRSDLKYAMSRAASWLYNELHSYASCDWMSSQLHNSSINPSSVGLSRVGSRDHKATGLAERCDPSSLSWVFLWVSSQWDLPRTPLQGATGGIRNRSWTTSAADVHVDKQWLYLKLLLGDRAPHPYLPWAKKPHRGPLFWPAGVCNLALSVIA